jgi:hypothetical protein
MIKWILSLFRQPKPQKIPGSLPVEEVDRLIKRAALKALDKYSEDVWLEMYLDPWREIDLRSNIMNEFVELNPYELMPQKCLIRANKWIKKLVDDVKKGRQEI